MESANTKLKWYFGKLSPIQIACGINCAISNARRLFEDAELLFKNGRYPSAVGLAILAIEEIGKVPILQSIAFASNDKEFKKRWREYRRHQDKNRPFVVVKYYLSGARKPKDFLPLLNDKETPQLIENLKQESFYSDCLDDVNWVIPTNSICLEKARGIIEATRFIIENMREVEEKEIEIMIKHFGPILEKGEKPSWAVIKKYHNELESMGLSKPTAENILCFLED